MKNYIPKRKSNKDFNCVRKVAEHIYTYGFYSREDYIKNKIIGSPRAYDDIIQQLNNLYFVGNDTTSSALIKDNRNRGKYKSYKFRRYYFGGADVQIAAMFGLCSAMEPEHTLKCLSMSSQDDGTNVTDVLRLYPNNQEYNDSEAPDISRTLRRRMDNMVSKGLLLKEGKKYKLNRNNVMEDISDEQLLQLYYLTSFYSGAGYPRVAAIYLKKSLLRMINYRGLDIPPDPFIFRDHTCGNLFDEPIVYELLNYCKNHTVVNIITFQKDGSEKLWENIHPIFVRPDIRAGRWYLFAINRNSPWIMKVSHIKKVDDMSISFDYTAERAFLEKSYHYCCFAGPRKDSKPIHVEASLSFDNNAMRLQFEREILIGYIEKRGETEYYCVDVGDVNDIKPFLRSYGAYVNIIPSEQHTLNVDLKNEYERMLSQYGII